MAIFFGEFPNNFISSLDGVPDSVLIVRYPEKVNEETLPAGVNKVFAISHGYDNIDLAFLKKEGIEFHRVPTGAVDVAEYCVSTAIYLLKRLPLASVASWERPTGERLKGKTWGIVGLGVIGRELASVVSKMGCLVKAYDPYVDADFVVKNLNELTSADIVSVHAPLTDETRGLVGKDFFANFKGILIDVSRGGVVNFEAAMDALKERQVKGLAFDVFPEEPFSGVIEEGMNVVFTPHLASLTEERWEDSVNFIKKTLSMSSTSE